MGAICTPQTSTSVRRLLFACVFAWAFGPATTVFAQDGSGRVDLPLAVYQDLMHNQAGDHATPGGFALGRATVNVVGVQGDDEWSADVSVDVPVRVFHARWTLVPLVAVGTALTAVTVNGASVELVPTPAGMAWATNEAGQKTVHLEY